MKLVGWRRVGAALLAGLLLLPAGVVRSRPAVADTGDLLGRALPPGARQVLAGLRIIGAIGARNRVYEEAHQVQRQLWAYYDARIETAQQQMIKREQLGLRDSQFQAYKRVKASLEAEREVVNQITEAEKKAARDRYGGRIRRELLGAIARSPKGQTALRDIRGALSDVRDRFGQLQAALEGGNPINLAVGDLQREVDRLRSAGQVMSLLSGRAGAALQEKANAVQGLINEVTGATGEAAAAGREALSTLDSAIGTLDQQIENPRRARAAADLLTEEDANAVLEKIFVPGGETPAEDVVADAIARGIDRNLVQNVGVALGELDPDELRTMRERVRAQLLRNRLDRIADRCGRLTGDSLRATLDALRDGSEPPKSTPCSLFRNPEKLEEFMRDFTGQTAGDTEAADTTTATTAITVAGSITGAVVEADTGDPVAGAVVTVVPAGPNTVTDGTGRFALAEIPVGTHTIGVTADGFTETTAQVEVETDQTTQATITLDRSDDLPWRFVGSAVLTRTIELGFGSGASVTIEPSVDIEITLHPDGTLDLFMQYPGSSMTVNCVEGTVYPTEGDPPPPVTGSGTHSAGNFEARPEGATILTTGTYTSSEIRGGWEARGTSDCDGKGTFEWVNELSFGPDGIPRSQGTP